VKLVDERDDVLTVAEACESVELPRATYYRSKSPSEVITRPQSPRRLTELERQRVLETLTSERFCDQSVRQVWAQLLDESKYLCSVRTMYRILEENQAVRERRNHSRGESSGA